jgi:putative transposase
MNRGKPPAPAIPMSERQYRLLETESRKRTTLRQYGQRIAILLRASKGQSNGQTKRELGLSLDTVKAWRKRWGDHHARLAAFEQGPHGEGVSDGELLKELLSVLRDAPRSGTPRTITLAQRQQIVALACRRPADFGLPFTAWSHPLLAQVSVSQGIVPRVSSRYIGTILKNPAPAPAQEPVLALPQDRRLAGLPGAGGPDLPAHLTGPGGGRAQAPPGQRGREDWHPGPGAGRAEGALEPGRPSAGGG